VLLQNALPVTDSGETALNQCIPLIGAIACKVWLIIPAELNVDISIGQV